MLSRIRRIRAKYKDEDADLLLVLDLFGCPLPLLGKRMSISLQKHLDLVVLHSDVKEQGSHLLGLVATQTASLVFYQVSTTFSEED